MCIISTTLGTVLGITAAVIGVASAAASTAIGITSSIQQGEQQQAYYNYQAQVAQENAKIAQSNAALERQQGIEESRLQRIKTAQAIGSQQTAMAANGIDVTQGTALDVIEDTAAMGELDALQTRYNYERKAIQYEQQANNFLNQGNLDVIAGQNAYSAGQMNALASGVSGIGKTADVAGKWFDFGGGSGNGLKLSSSKGIKYSGGFDGDWYGA